MGWRVLEVHSVEAWDIPENIRHIGGLTVRPYLEAKSDASGHEVKTSPTKKSGSAADERPSWSWRTSFLVELQQVEVQGEVVVFSLFIQRTIKPHKLVATLEMPVADFAQQNPSSSTAAPIHEMKFVKEKYLVRNGDKRITIRICGQVNPNVSNRPQRSRPPPNRGLMNTFAVIGGGVATAVGLASDIQSMGEGANWDESNDANSAE